MSGSTDQCVPISAVRWGDIADLFEAGEQLADYADDYAAHLRDTYSIESWPADIDDCIARWRRSLAAVRAAIACDDEREPSADAPRAEQSE